MQLTEIRQQILAQGAKPCHEARILRAWLQGRPLDAGARRRLAEDELPLRLRQALPQLGEAWAALVGLRSSHPDADGSVRLLLALQDGHTIESVLLPRDGVCVSTQVGCAVGCLFCQTGCEGLLRQLGSAEIVAQVVLARQWQKIRRVVFMGMGEPAHNLEEVLEAIDLLGSFGGLAHKNLVLSTVGDRRLFKCLKEARVKPALALSLHTTRADLRLQLMPRAPRLSPEELVSLAQDYARLTGHPVQYQWTLLDGINDGQEEMAGIVRLLAGQYAIMNLIPCNPAGDGGFRRPSLEVAEAMARELNRSGVLTKLRYSAGQEVEGGCGQLRARQLQSVAA